MSTASITASTINGTTRITGLSSGIDVDNIVEQLVTAEKAKKLNKLQQAEQTAEWTQEAYREIITDLQDFTSEYFDVTSSSSILKASNFLQTAATSTDTAVTVTSASTASAGNHTVEVSQLATVATINSSADVQASAAADYTDLSGQTFVMTVDGTDYTIDLDTVTDLTTLQTAIETAVGSDMVTASVNSSGYLVFTAADTDVEAISISDPASGTSGLTDLGFGTDAVLSNQTAVSISKNVQGSATASYVSGTNFVLTLDGTDYTISIDDTVTNVATLQTAIDDAVGEGKITISENSSGYLEITAADEGIQVISISATSTTDEGLTKLFGSDPILSNRLTTSDSLATIADQLSSSTALTFTAAGEISLTINGTVMTFDQDDDSLADMMSEINSADLGVTMTYNTITGALVMTADNTGAGATLVVTDTDSTTSNFATLLLNGFTAGVDAKLTVDGQALTRSSNSVTIDGVTYTANKVTTAAASVTVTQDTDGVYELLSSFVDDYNTLIETINTAVDENADSDYPPLTDDEKAEMTDEEITAWELKAKVGLLESDSTLEKLLSSLRTALVDSVSGSTISLSSIGITTSTYDENGKLYIDEDKLTAAIASDPEAIMELFTQQATATKTNSAGTAVSIGTTSVLRSLTASELSTRYSQEGIAYRIYDTLQANISTTRDNASNKGTLLEKAGTENDTTDTDNVMSTLIDKYEEELEEEQDRLDEFEENLYTKYSALETYINKMNSQLSALSSYTSE